MDDTMLMEIGKRIQKCRKQLGFTQEQLAEKMNVSIQMISNLERGMKAIRIDNLVNLSRILHVSTDYILTGTDTSGDLQGISASVAQLTPKDREMIRMITEYCLDK